MSRSNKKAPGVAPPEASKTKDIRFTNPSLPSPVPNFIRNSRPNPATRGAVALSNSVSSNFLGNTQIMLPPLSLGDMQEFETRLVDSYLRRRKSASILGFLNLPPNCRYLGHRKMLDEVTGEIIDIEFSANRSLRPPRVARCGWAGFGYPSIETSRDGSHAVYNGVEKCSSIWSCPCCASTIRAHRSKEIEKATNQHIALGGSLIFVTLTLRHHQGDKLADTLDALLNGWRKFLAGNPWRRVRDRFGISGYIRSIEVTYGANGWHPHAHLLLFVDSSLSPSAVADLEDFMASRWVRIATRLTGKAPTREHGLDFQLVGNNAEIVSQYVAKLQLDKTCPVSLEMARQDLKNGRLSGSLNPFQLIDIAPHLWREYYLATFGRMCITWSRGLKNRFDIDDMDDDEILALETVSPSGLRQIWRMWCTSDYMALWRDNPRRLGEELVSANRKIYVSPD